MKRLTPQEKKRLRYSKDHFVEAEYPHAFRRYWPKKKALASRAYRRTIRHKLVNIQEIPVLEEVDTHIRAIRREEVNKGGATFLRELVDNKLSKRRHRLGWNFFKRPYSTVLDRKRFIVFLASLTEGKSQESTEYARVVEQWLDPPIESARWLRIVERQKWLHAFFQDEPEWENCLRQWVDKLLATD